MELNKLRLNDKKLFSRFLNHKPHQLSVYAFENIYIWNGLFDISWTIMKESLCLFFINNNSSFLYLPPLGPPLDKQTVSELFNIMDTFNRNREVSRIENVEEKDIDFYRGMGYLCVKKSVDYIYSRKELADLKGPAFKAKRKGFNHFVKNHSFEYITYKERHKRACMALYDKWMLTRQAKNREYIYKAMLEDSRNCLTILLDNYKELGFIGSLAKVNGSLAAFSFGFELNKDMFCIAYEVADHSVKGSSEFIFCQFCKELEGYSYINAMDDSGLENLKRTKLSYRPVELAASYIIKRGDNC